MIKSLSLVTTALTYVKEQEKYNKPRKKAMSKTDVVCSFFYTIVRKIWAFYNTVL